MKSNNVKCVPQIYDQSNEYTHKGIHFKFQYGRNIITYPHAITNMKDERKVCTRAGMLQINANFPCLRLNISITQVYLPIL